MTQKTHDLFDRTREFEEVVPNVLNRIPKTEFNTSSMSLLSQWNRDCKSNLLVSGSSKYTLFDIENCDEMSDNEKA